MSLLPNETPQGQAFGDAAPPQQAEQIRRRLQGKVGMARVMDVGEVLLVIEARGHGIARVPGHSSPVSPRGMTPRSQARSSAGGGTARSMVRVTDPVPLPTSASQQSHWSQQGSHDMEQQVSQGKQQM